MRTTQQLREAWPATCRAVPLRAIELVPGVTVQMHVATDEAVKALGCVYQAHRYPVRSGDTGAYNCRKITGGSKTSLHAHGIALDVNWNTNPYRTDGRLVTDMPPKMVADVKRIRTKGGVRVWGWGGDYRGAKDAMHFEILASPAELAQGIDWSTVQMAKQDPTNPATYPLLEEGDRGPAVALLQKLLGVASGGVSRFGPKTLAAVVAYQKSHGLTPDGRVGLQTWTALLTDQPALKPGDPSPVKRTVEA